MLWIGKIGGDGRAAGRQRFEDQHRVEALEADAAKLFPGVDRRKAKRRRLAQNINGKLFVPVPLPGFRGQFFPREQERRLSDRQLFRGHSE